MLRIILAAAVAASALLDPASALAQAVLRENPAPPPRDTVADKKGTGVIRGRVTSAEAGRPLRRVQVRISAPELSEARTVSTNSQGRYEVRDLPAGRYTIRVTRSGYLSLEFGQRRPLERGRPLQLADGRTIENADFALPRMGVVSGRITDEVGEPIAGVTVWAFQTRYFQGRRQLVPNSGNAQTDDTGQYRLLALPPGTYVVRGSIRETWVMEGEEKQTLAFAPTYFPGGTTPAEAQAVKVDVGQEVTAVDFTLVQGRAARVSGTIMTSQGLPLAGESVTVTQETTGPQFASMSSYGGAKTAADGSFTIKDLPPGDYKLEARVPALKDRPAEFAAFPVTVAGADIEALVITTGTAGDLSGSVSTEDGSPLPPGPIRMRVATRALNPQTTPRMTVAAGAIDNGRVNNDGTFELKGAIGQLRLMLTGVPPGWYLKSIDAGGKDIVDSAIEVRSGQTLSGLRFLISNRPTTVSGRLDDARGQPSSDGTVLIFAVDQSKWGEDSRYIASVRPDQQGRFEHQALPPGEYYAAALAYVADGEGNDPEFLDKLKDAAQRFTLTEGARETINLVLK
jgi:hypothetical protein